MKLQIKKCRTCGALGVGPRAVKLYPMNGHLYCPNDWKGALTWEESRSEVLRGLQAEDQNMKDFVGAWQRVSLPPRPTVTTWTAYLHELSGMAGWALQVGDRRTFVHYFSRAMWAWELSEGAR